LDRPEARPAGQDPARGRLQVVARTVEEAEEASRQANEAALLGPRHAGFVDLCGTRAYFKQSQLAGKTRLRYALKRGLLRSTLPRLAEYENLAWLRAHGFHAPEPLAAGVSWRGGLPRFQFLFTRAVGGAETLAEILAAGVGRPDRPGILDLLAREVARMHAAGFVHHDLFARNILVTGSPKAARVWFLDCWAGGPGPQLRGPAYDLACLLGSEGLTPTERSRCSDVYAADRQLHGSSGTRVR